MSNFVPHHLPMALINSRSQAFSSSMQPHPPCERWHPHTAGHYVNFRGYNASPGRQRPASNVTRHDLPGAHPPIYPEDVFHPHLHYPTPLVPLAVPTDGLAMAQQILRSTQVVGHEPGYDTDLIALDDDTFVWMDNNGMCVEAQRSPPSQSSTGTDSYETPLQPVPSASFPGVSRLSASPVPPAAVAMSASSSTLGHPSHAVPSAAASSSDPQVSTGVGDVSNERADHSSALPPSSSPPAGTLPEAVDHIRLSEQMRRIQQQLVQLRKQQGQFKTLWQHHLSQVLHAQLKQEEYEKEKKEWTAVKQRLQLEYVSRLEQLRTARSRRDKTVRDARIVQLEGALQKLVKAAAAATQVGEHPLDALSTWKTKQVGVDDEGKTASVGEWGAHRTLRGALRVIHLAEQGLASRAARVESCRELRAGVVDAEQALVAEVEEVPPPSPSPVRLGRSRTPPPTPTSASSQLTSISLPSSAGSSSLESTQPSSDRSSLATCFPSPAPGIEDRPPSPKRQRLDSAPYVGDGGVSGGVKRRKAAEGGAGS